MSRRGAMTCERRGGAAVLHGRLHELLTSPRRMCPDCGVVVPWASVREGALFGGVQFFECPVCEVGSPRAEWEAARA